MSWQENVEQLRAARSVAFICVANSARSQMAEGIARSLAPASVTVYSAGSQPGKLNPWAVRALDEIGLDITHHRAKALDELPLSELDAVVALCAEEQCPALPPGSTRIDWSMPDPAGAHDDDEATLNAFRAVRDELRQRLTQVFET